MNSYFVVKTTKNYKNIMKINDIFKRRTHKTKLCRRFFERKTEMGGDYEEKKL